MYGLLIVLIALSSRFSTAAPTTKGGNSNEFREQLIVPNLLNRFSTAVPTAKGGISNEAREQLAMDPLKSTDHDHPTFIHIPEIYRPRPDDLASGRCTVPKTLVEWIAYLDYMEQSHTLPAHNANEFVAVDCEMVGTGPRGSQEVLARVSVVDYHGNVMLDTYVAPNCKVTDYRTKYSGVRKGDLDGAPQFKHVTTDVARLIKDHKLVGHSVHNDLRVLKMQCPPNLRRDTSTLKHLTSKSQTPSLRTLIKDKLGVIIQDGTHDSVDDARASMLLFRLFWPRPLVDSNSANDRRQKQPVTEPAVQDLSNEATKEHNSFMHLPELYRPRSSQVPTTLTEWFTYLDYMDHHYAPPSKRSTKKFIAVGSEMVRTGAEKDHFVLSRVSFVDYRGQLVLDTFVAPRSNGSRHVSKQQDACQEDLEEPPQFKAVKESVTKLIRGQKLIGYRLHHDLHALKLYCPPALWRDVSTLKLLATNSETPKLSMLTNDILGVTIQKGLQDSIAHARASMLLFRMFWPRRL